MIQALKRAPITSERSINGGIACIAYIVTLRVMLLDDTKATHQRVQAVLIA